MAAGEAVGLVRPNDTIVIPTGVAEPPALLTALSAHRHRLSRVKVSQILGVGHFEYLDPLTAHNVQHVAFFFGGSTRPGGQAGWCDYIPNNFSEIPAQIRRGLIPADVVFSYASPMDQHGYFALGLAADYTMAAISKARAVVLEVNPNIPYTLGNCHVHISNVAAVVETSNPIREVGLPTIGELQQKIGSYVSEMIPNGATLQIGYGGIPDAVVMQLTGKRDLGIHTEMLGDGIMSLVEAGVVTGARKNFMPGKIIATFALGSEKLYRFMDRNPGLELHPADFTNDPWTAGSNDNLISINSSLQVDLLGQCASESLGTVPYSGTGGQSDFVRAANRSAGGKSFIVLPSTAKNDTVSRIVACLSEGAHVTTSKNDVNYVVTEYGVAQLRGKSMRQRALALIGIAHPRFREQLEAQSRQLRFI